MTVRVIARSVMTSVYNTNLDNKGVERSALNPSSLHGGPEIHATETSVILEPHLEAFPAIAVPLDALSRPACQLVLLTNHRRQAAG